MNRGRVYFALQAAAGAAWWIAVALSPPVREATLGSLDPVVVAVLDIPLFVVGSALAAAGAKRAAWVAAGWTVLVALALAGFATVTGEAGWGVVVMAAAAGGSLVALGLVVLGRIPTEWVIAGPFAFRPAMPRSRKVLHVIATFGQIVVFWGFFLVVVPLLISFLEKRWGVGFVAPWFVAGLGAVVLLLASALGIWAAIAMSTRGNGTPLPAAMPTTLVVAGPYRYVRNPMAVAGIVQGAAVGLMLSSWLVVVYALIGSVLWNYAVRPHEEADLEARFGDQFRRYRDAVRCWVPRRPRVLVALLLVGVAVAVTGCTQSQAAGSLVGPSTTYGGVTFVDDLDYGAPDGVRLDVCLPEGDAAARPAVISVHGGSWSGGDKGQGAWREVCAWLASEGFVAFQVNYRLAPAHPYPAAIDDVTTAVEWIRADAQVARFAIDPARLGAFGDSAGGNLAALLGTRGEGDTTTGTRVAAVVDLSGPTDLTREGTELGDLGENFQRVELDYLGCGSFDDCAVARDASPLYQVDASDPPFFIAHSVDEFVPVEQAEAFVTALEGAGVDVTYVPVPGDAHALAMLDEPLLASISGWLHDRLGR